MTGQDDDKRSTLCAPSAIVKADSARRVITIQPTAQPQQRGFLYSIQQVLCLDFIHKQNRYDVRIASARTYSDASVVME